MMTRIRSLALAVVLVGAAAACSSSSSSGTPTTGSSSSSGGSGTTVTIKNFQFSPATLTVKVGAKVTFVNEDTTPHTATSSSGSPISSGNLNHGQSYTVTFTKPGTYQYTCTIHPFMRGTVTVQ